MADTRMIQGLDAALAKMRGLTPKLRSKAVRPAARKAMNIVRDAARANARAIDDPETPEKIYKNIVTKESRRKGKRLNAVVTQVGVLGGASRNAHSADATGNPGGDTRHWRYDEFGTENQPAQPILRPALANNVDHVIDTFVAALNPAIDKIVAKQA